MNTYSDFDTFCTYRLPCGICKFTGLQCAKVPLTVNPIWTASQYANSACSASQERADTSAEKKK